MLEPIVTIDHLMAHNRDKLNQIGRDNGVADPEGYQNKRSLAEAVHAQYLADIEAHNAEQDAQNEPESDDASPQDSGPVQEPEDAQEPATDADDGRVTIRGVGPEHRVAFWEQHPDHPNGEVMVQGGQEARAAMTSAVTRALREGRIGVVK